MEQSSEELNWNMIKKRKIFLLFFAIRHYIAIFVTFFFFLYKYIGNHLDIIDTKRRNNKDKK